MHTLNPYRALFRDTLKVPNVSLDMLITELLNKAPHPSAALNEDTFQYCKDLLMDINRIRETNDEQQRLNRARCWPCRSPLGQPTFSPIGDFYINDRQHLFDIFSSSMTFLDFDFNSTQIITGLLRSRGCVSFLSERVTMDTEALQPLEIDHALTQNYRRRADALDKYVPVLPGLKSD
jgi:hypothetical protein